MTLVTRDYFPLEAGAAWTYRHTSTDFEGEETVVVRIEALEPHGKGLSAYAKLTRLRDGRRSKAHSFRIRRTAEEVFSGFSPLGFSRRDFARPLARGRTWTEGSDRHVVASLNAAVETPAGRFSGCLRVNTYLAGGDSGSAVRFYAPGVGLVRETHSSESLGAEVELSNYSKTSSSS